MGQSWHFNDLTANVKSTKEKRKEKILWKLRWVKMKASLCSGNGGGKRARHLKESELKRVTGISPSDVSIEKMMG